MEDDYLEKAIEEVLDACCVFNNVVREGIKQKILYDLDNLKTPNASQVADSDLIWSTLDMEADLQIENQPRQKSIDGASISKRMKLYIIRNSLIVFMLCALFCITVAAAFVLSFPRSQIGVWKEKGRLALLSVAVAGASLAVASLVFCLLSANGLLRYLFYKKLSHYVHLPITMSSLHRVFGIIVLLGSIVHSIAWFPLYWSISSSEGWVNGDSKYRYIGNLGGRSRSMTGLCTSYVSITGYAMLGILLLGSFIASGAHKRLIKNETWIGKYIRSFEAFKLSHWIMAATFCVLLFFHPLPTLPSWDATQGFGSITWIFISIPILLLVLSVGIRWYRRSKSVSSIILCQTLPNDALSLTVRAPGKRRWQPGTYAHVSVPSISKYQWHPFSITSFSKNNLTLYIKAVGDWTKELHHQACQGNLVATTCYVDGPYMTSTCEYKNYSHIVMVAGGIGVTPFVSVTAEMMEHSHQCRSLTLHWVVRDIEAARTWFKTLFESMEDLRQSSENCSIRVNIWLTGIKPELVKLAKRVGSIHADVCGLDILSGIRIKSSNTMSHFGRPDFGQLLGDYDPGASVAESPVGVFCCGPTSMVASLRHACNTFSAISGKHFALHAEDFHSY
jgi:hypothetical protein